MSRFLVAGLCPLPFENTLKTFGPGIRTSQLAWSLARAGHEVRLLAMRAPGAYEPGEQPQARETRDGVRIERLSDVAFFDPRTIRRAIRDEEADALVGATFHGSAAIAAARSALPFWGDEFGHAMAEAQAKAAAERRNWPVAFAWNLVRPVLLAVDRLSVVSERQRYAAIGELGAVGRLTAETCGYEFTAVIPCALVPPEEAPATSAAAPVRAIRGRLAPDDAFVVLWSGGFNVWSDAETVARGLDMALESSPRLHFVATGGAIPGLDSATWDWFRDWTRRSSHRERLHLEGWVAADRVAAYVAEADVGILADRPIYEGLLGSKNRIVQWMGAGLPVIYNRVGELGDLLAEQRLGLTFPAGDAAALAESLTWAAAHPAELREMAGRAWDVARREMSFEATTRPLVEWAAAPCRAPDAGRRARDPWGHAELRQRVAAAVRRVPVLRRSETLVDLWRRLHR